MTRVEIVKGDKNLILQFQILDADGDPIDLSNATATLKFKNYEDGSVHVLEGSIVDATNGKVQFNTGDKFENLEGEFKGEIELVFQSGQKITAPNIVIKVIPSIG